CEVKAFSWPPIRATTCENFPVGFLAVPLNIKCSRKCANPDLPGVSSAAPTLYQIMCVTTGARRSGMTTSSSPLASVELATSGPAANEGVAIAVTSAINVKFVLRSTFLGLNMLRSCVSTKSDDVAHHKAKIHLQLATLLHRLGMRCVVVCRLRRRVFAKAIRLIRRRRLVSRRRIGQRIARWLASKFRRLVFLAIEHAAPHAVLESELRGHDLAAEAGGRWLVTVVGTRLFFLRLSAGRQLIRTQWILFALPFVADVTALLRCGLRPAPLDVGVFRPGWIVGSG